MASFSGVVKSIIEATISALNTTSKTIVGAINEINTAREYHAGDSVTLRESSGGFLTSAGKSVRLTLHLAKPIGSDVKSVSVTYSQLDVRQDGLYLIGNASGTTPDMTDITASYIITAAGVRATFAKSSAYGGTNNAPIGVDVNCVITFN